MMAGPVLYRWFLFTHWPEIHSSGPHNSATFEQRGELSPLTFGDTVSRYRLKMVITLLTRWLKIFRWLSINWVSKDLSW